MRYNRISLSAQGKYVEGDHFKICDRSGFKIRSSDSRREWNGSIVHKHFFEPRHPQDLVKGKPDKQNVINPRPESADHFLGANEVTSDDL